MTKMTKIVYDKDGNYNNPYVELLNQSSTALMHRLNIPEDIQANKNPCSEIPLTYIGAEMTYKRGDIFTNKFGDFYILAQCADVVWALIGLQDGNRWHSAEINDQDITPQRDGLTQKAFDMVGGSETWERVGSWNEMMAKT